MLSVWKTEKMRDEVLASVRRGVRRWQLGPTCQQRQRQKFWRYFLCTGGIEHGRNSRRVVSLGHWASSVLSLQIRPTWGGPISSYAFVRSPWRCCLLLWTCWTNERNLERTVRGETDSRDPSGLWPYASKCLIKKILPPIAILTLGPTGLSTKL